MMMESAYPAASGDGANAQLMARKRHGRAVVIFGVALAYAVIGNLSVSLAIPPGYATMIWPAAGLALAVVLIYGNRVWPGIVAGSFLVNIWTGLDGDITFTTFLVPFLISCGAAFQAVIGAYFVHRFAHFPNNLAYEREVFAFMLWGGLVGCATNALVGTGVLMGFGIIPMEAFVVNLATWWTGDMIGVFVFTPLVLAWFMEPREIWRPRRATITLPIVTAVVVSFFAVWLGLNWERERLKLEFDQQVAPLAQALEKTVLQYIDVLHFVEGFYAASALVERDEFSAYVKRPFAELVGLQALSWNPVVRDEDRKRFEMDTRGEGFPNFQITERNSDNQLVPAARRSSYVVVDYIEPFDKNQKAFGFDVASNPVRKMAMDVARDRGRPMATGRITLVQDTDKQFGLLVFMPVYAKGVSLATVDDRRDNLRGFLVGVFRGEDLVHAALQGLNQEGVAYRLVDKSAPQDQQFLMENRPRAQAIFALNERGLFGGSTAFGKAHEIQFGGRTWSFETAPTQEFLVHHRQGNAWLVLIGGMLASSLVGAFVMMVSGRRQVLQVLVAEKTANLRQSESRLAEAQRIAKIGDWAWLPGSDRLRMSEEAFRILEMPPTPDGVPLSDILGLVPQDERDALKAGFDEIVKAHQAFSLDHTLVLEGGGRKVVHQQAEMAFDEDGQAQQVVGTIQDISERMRLDQMKQDFISTVSHELRTPLTSIKGSLGIVAGGALGEMPGKAKELISIAHRNTNQLIDLVNDILDIGKFESGKMEFEMMPLNLANLVQESLDVNRDYALESGVSFVVSEMAPDLVVEADYTRIMQVMANLLSNAAKFSPSGGAVSIIVKREGNAAKVQVTDRGEGIPTAFRGHVFERFAQADSSSARQKGGTGLGLSITKLIVESHGGEIGFISEMGVGSSFYFLLPVMDKST